MPAIPTSETAIRDAIAASPQLIEVGLRTVGRNYHVPNSEGTRGFIDVLARDRHGLFVVIEIKRSDSAAREAIHEVLKYCELLRAQTGLRTDQVRAIIASSSWRELLVPFSEMSRVSEYPIEGIKLIIDDDFPASMRAERVTSLPFPAERDLSALALRFELAAPEEADALWPRIVERLADVGIDDALGIVAGNNVRAILHVALGTVVEGDPRVPPDLAEDKSDEAPEGQEREYAAAVHALRDLPSAELVSPERLTRIIATNQLAVLNVLRAGRYADQAGLVNDHEAVELAEGRSGWNQVKAILTGRPAHALAWRRLRERLEYVLSGNPRWGRLLGLWLDEIEEADPAADVVLQVYNPCDLMAALVHSGLGMNLPHLLPEIQGGLDLAGDEGRLLHGTLVWDGTPVADAVTAIQTVYATPGEWGMARASGRAWVDDLRLLEALGLRYELFEFTHDSLGGAYRLEEHNRLLRRDPATSGTSTWPGIRPFPEWLRAVDLRSLLDRYRATMRPANGGDQWLVVDGPPDGA